MKRSIKKVGMAIFGLAIAGQGALLGNTNCCCCGQFFVEAGVLGFRAYEGGLTSICDNVDIVDTTVDGVTISTLEGSSRDPDFNWNAGFRVGAGYELNCVGIGAFYTHFNSHTNSKHHRNNALQWKVNFDEVDLLLGREYNVGRCFIVTPYGGLRYANIDQTLTTNLLTNNNGAVTTSNGRIKEHFYGIGPLFGIDGDWRIACGFSLYADLAVSLLYGSFRVTSDQTDRFDSTLNVNHLNDHLQAYQTVLDTGLGIRWRTCFCNNTQLIVQLGLESQRFFNHNQICGYGDLSLDGVSLGIGLLF